MSKLIKKVFKAVKKVASGVTKFVKKYWKQIAIAALVVFTAGAASVVAAGGTWGGALTSVGSTFSAGASALTGGAIGTSAATTMGANAGAASLAAGASVEVAAAQGIAAQAAATSTAASAGGVAGGISSAASSVGGLVGKGLSAVGVGGTTTAGTTAATGAAAGTGAATAAGTTVGEAMLLGTKIQAAGALYNGYEQKKAEERFRKEKENEYFYGMNGKGEYADGFGSEDTPQALSPTYQRFQSDQQPNQNLQMYPGRTLLNRAAYTPVRV